MPRADVLFVNPYLTVAGDHMFNEGILWIASYLHRNGVRVRILALNRPSLEENHEKLRDALRRHEPRFVLISGRWWDSLHGTVDVARRVKELLPSAVVGTGGETAGHFAAELCSLPEIDFVVRGKSELPLLHAVRGERLVNCTWKQDGSVRHGPMEYFHTADDLAESRLEPLEELFDAPDLELGASPYVWLGDGCPYDCLFCTNAASSQERPKVMYRPAERVLHDLEVLGRLRDVFLFDFQPTRSGALEEVIRQVPSKRYGVIYEPWAVRLMDTDLVDRLCDAFSTCKFVFDPQVFSEELRSSLAGRRAVKPFVSNEHLERLLAHIGTRENARFSVSGLCGLPGEEARHVQAGEQYRQSLLERFPAMESSYVLPLVTEPGSPLARDPEAHGAVLLRRTFDEYLAHSRDVLFPAPVPWFMTMLGIAKEFARSPRPEHVSGFNRHCGVITGPDPARALTHAAMTLRNPANQFHLAERPFRAEEIETTSQDGTRSYRIAGNGRALLNLAIVARDALASGAERIELDLRECAWLAHMTEPSICPSSVYSFNYLHHDPAVPAMFAATRKGALEVRCRALDVPERSFLRRVPGLLLDERPA
jgi:hypothetical protein